jgi:hypothetical protein
MSDHRSAPFAAEPPSDRDTGREGEDGALQGGGPLISSLHGNLSERASTVYRVSEKASGRSSQFMNPFAVGYTGETLQDHRATCECCRIEFVFRAPASQKHRRKRCDHCADHQLEGTTDQQLAAFREHHNRYPAVVAKAREMAREAMSAKERAERELESGRRRVAAALRSRDATGAFTRR